MKKINQKPGMIKSFFLSIKYKFFLTLFDILDRSGYFLIRLSRKCAVLSTSRLELETNIQEANGYMQTGIEFDEHKEEISEGIHDLQNNVVDLEGTIKFYEDNIIYLYDSFLQNDRALMSNIFCKLGLNRHIEGSIS